MNIILLSLVILILSGGLSLCFNRSSRLSNLIGAAGAAVACLVGMIAVISIYCNPATSALNMAWKVPFGSLAMAADSLSLLFLLPIYIVSGLSALYGFEYLRHYYGKKNIGSAWFFYNILIISMILVVVSRNAVLFLLAWEMMSVSSFFLVLFEGEKKEAARAGRIYLIATNIGTLFLLVMFVLLGHNSGSFDFADWQLAPSSVISSIIFLCAVIGFGTKAGFMPMHVWLPEAHPAAPSHVSAVMSGVMIKTGIYGVVRVVTFLGVPCAWWGYLLIAIGISSGVLGVLFALAQHDLKRLLAYHSIENIGIITIGIGLGVLGMSQNNPVLMVMGFAGGLLHVINHAFFKGLLFLGAGAVIQETGTREIDVLGGLLKKMPVTGFCFLVGAAAICGLPPLNGFISEFLLYFASFKAVLGPLSIAVVALAVIAFLALIGGLASACFTKAFGIIFLGEPRSSHCENVHESGILMRASMLILATLCVAIGLGGAFILPFFRGVIVDITGVSFAVVDPTLFEAKHTLVYIVAASLLLYLLVLLLAGVRRALLKGRCVEHVLTWDCGYAKPEPRMQYTASSFTQPIVDFFKGILRTRNYVSKIEKYFPDQISFKTETPDLFSEVVFSPLMKVIHFLAEKLTLIQHGRVQIYILYILVTLIALFIWKS